MKTADATTGNSYAVGLVVDRTPCGIAYQHNGGGAGFKTSAFVSGDGNCVAVVLLNGNAGDARADLAIYAAAKRLYCASRGTAYSCQSMPSPRSTAQAG